MDDWLMELVFKEATSFGSKYHNGFINLSAPVIFSKFIEQSR
jgi:hypothetical protein